MCMSVRVVEVPHRVCLESMTAVVEASIDHDHGKAVKEDGDCGYIRRRQGG